jgi:hypothetical protein
MHTRESTSREKFLIGTPASGPDMAGYEGNNDAINHGYPGLAVNMKANGREGISGTTRGFPGDLND